MKIEWLKLYQYRNYEALTLKPGAGICVFVGQNAAGKTNILESVFLCALGRSHRTGHDSELIAEGQGEGMVSLRVKTRAGSRTIRCQLSAKERKRVTLDNTPLARSGELMGCLNVVMFSPEDLELVKGGPGARRRFLDMELSQLYPAYYFTLQRYNGVLKQRNMLLKNPHCGDDPTLELWESQLARLGADITRRRAVFVRELAALAQALHGQMTDGAESLEILYQPNLPPTADEELAEAMCAELVANRERDMTRGSTSVGPHRDDLAFFINGTDARVYGSQGQQRTAALAAKLSEIALVESVRGEKPVLLLDDVFSELDTGRQSALLSAVSGCQTFITCTHLGELAFLGAKRMKVFNVGNGKVM
ncbi:MAG: DNA replication/repair protein RecF [Clostridiales bacterium]|nr:DNA replication/repair protein RecF [Clostridiales bacterium]